MIKSYITWKGGANVYADGAGSVKRVSTKTVRKQFAEYMTSFYWKLFKEPKMILSSIYITHRCAYCGWDIPPRTKIIRIRTCEQPSCNCARKVYHEHCGQTRYKELPKRRLILVDRVWKLYEKNRSIKYLKKRYPYDVPLSPRNKTKDRFNMSIKGALNFYYHYGYNSFNSGLNCVHYDVASTRIKEFRKNVRYPNKLEPKHVDVIVESRCTYRNCWCQYLAEHRKGTSYERF
tara:strand:- start:269 stop:967 length:699 start_codon:yes stop_codon:yes gene_type:complete